MLKELAPGFLLAAPVLTDPQFSRSVVLLVEHKPEGSLGFVVNRAGSAELKAVAGELGVSLRDQLGMAKVLSGGPVAPWTGWIVYDPRGPGGLAPGSVVVSDAIAVSASRELLQSIANGEGPARAVLMLGYAGWGAGQLDEELKHGAWLPADLDDQILFETPLDDRWAQGVASLGVDPARITSAAALES